MTFNLQDCLSRHMLGVLHPFVHRYRVCSCNLFIVFRAGESKSDYEFKIDFYKEIIPEVLVLMRVA